MKSSPAKQLALIVLVALALRLAGGWVWQSRLDGRFGFGDSESYWTLGRSVAFGQSYRYGDARVFRTPGYPALLAPIFFLGGSEPSVMWARAESALFGVLAVVGVWWLGRQLFDARTGLVAAWIAAVYPGAIAISALVLSEAAFCPLMLAHLILWTAAWRASSPRRTAVLSGVAGLVAGAATLVRPSWLLFVPFAVAVGLVLGKPRRRHLGIGAMMLAGLLVAMMPWWIRNARATGQNMGFWDAVMVRWICKDPVPGHFVPTTLQVGTSLYDGLGPQATGASDMAFVDRFAEEERLRAVPVGDGTFESFEYQLDQRLRAESLAWSRAHPGRAVQLAAIKLVRLWNVWPNQATFSMWYLRLAVLLTYVPVMVLAAAGIGKTIHRGWPYVLCWLPAVYFTLLHVVFVSSIRYRQPAMLALMVLAAGAIALRSGRPEQSGAESVAETPGESVPGEDPD
jgi:4-amino-4-deoxy-L-arabinose transferase-like glycosyltransferase